MITVRAKRTTVGEYGKLKKGDVVEMRGSVAKRLALKEIVELVSNDNGIEVEHDPTAYSIRIHQNGEVISDSAADRKIIRKETVIKPEEPQPIKSQLDDIPVFENLTQGLVITEMSGDPVEIKADDADDKKEPAPETKATPAEEPKKEVKETPKKQYQSK